MKQTIYFISALALGILLIFAYSKVMAKKLIISPQLSVSPTPTKFSLENAPSQSLRGQIASFSGDVEWQSRTASEGAKLMAARVLQQGENLETKDTGTISFSFPNLGTVAMQPKSKLEIIQTLPINVVLTQDSGTVTYDKTGSVPLSVKTMHLLLKPKDGTMTVTSNTKTDSVRIEMASGSAQVAYEDTNNNTQAFRLNPKETLVFDDDSREVTTF